MTIDIRAGLSVRPKASVATRVTAEALAGGALLAVGAGFILVTMLATSMAPGYDVRGGAISDLGVIPETALVFNVLLVGIGALNLGAGYMLARGRPWLLGTFAVASLGAIGAGLVPLDRGGLHGIFALLAFIAFNVEVLGAAMLVRGAVRWLGLAAGAVGLLYVVLMVIGDAGNPAVFGAIGHGGAERLIAYPAMLWLIALGGQLLGRASEPAAVG